MKEKLLIGLGVTVMISLLGLLVWAISFSMSNDQIIAETKKCQKAGMEANQVVNILTYHVTAVICLSK